ncbi:MAG: 1-acyl-sn-glycerol-3-phosphate acyltransferase [Burkholderiaceae bacterium]|nr:MAG: 1-acyl-sn-glycerol-3-phosphate acyltransferase [Burkholderiaceae bacterium]
MHIPRLVWHSVLLTAQILLGVLIIFFGYRFLPLSWRHAVTRWWSRDTVTVSNARIVVRGAPPLEAQGCMLLFNHISWLDIPVINSIVPTRFVAKAELRRWPLVGRLCAASDTLFIERGRRHAVHQVMHLLKEAMQAGARVGIFPEGTTSAGDMLLPFHANLMQAALEAGVPVIPVALRYFDRHGQVTRTPAYFGEMNIFQSLVQVLSAEKMVVEITFLAPIIVTAETTRHEVAQHAHAAISASLGFVPQHS